MRALRVPACVPLRAVIFDVDGVLVQSMERHADAYQRTFADLGISIRREEVFANEGRRSREVIETLATERKLGLTAEQLDALNRKKQETYASFGTLPLYPGVPELVRAIKARGVKVAAVTGTSRVNVETHLAPLVTEFDAIVTADDVRHTKPDPEPYLAALAKLEVAPSDAFVVENAPLGVRSAVAAGIPVVGVLSTLPASALKGVDTVVEKVADIWELVEGMT
jgi:beta-phosphoglucomutase